MDKKVTVYTFNTCPFCIKAKNLLDNEGIEFDEIDITTDRGKLKELESKTGSSTVPQIFAGDKFIGGCDDLMELHKSGEFDQVLR
ncbi:glutaredoxin 3 [Dethiothermospora halolimnae]|uniref:glutaredoxin 3 n=1 Tax=Dethiothermospora halolimnae TaxID=3114390 RepID=UPI003CCC2FD4